MSHPAYPVASDLQTALEEAGMFDAAWNLNLESAVSGAVQSWEKDTDWGPYLANDAESSRRFTLRGEKTLWLRSGLIQAPSQVMIDGIEQTLEVDYFLESANSKPYTRLKFLYPRRSREQGVFIQGTWGAVEAIDDVVWRAILHRAALSLGGSIRQRLTADKAAAQNQLIKAKQSGTMRAEYATVDGVKALDFDATFESWATTYSDALQGRVMQQP